MLTILTLKYACFRLFSPPVLNAFDAEGIVTTLADPVRQLKDSKTDWTDNSLKSTSSLLILYYYLILSYYREFLLFILHCKLYQSYSVKFIYKDEILQCRNINESS